MIRPAGIMKLINSSRDWLIKKMKSSELNLITVTMTAVFKPKNHEYPVSQTTENDC